MFLNLNAITIIPNATTTTTTTYYYYYYINNAYD